MKMELFFSKCFLPILIHGQECGAVQPGEGSGNPGDAGQDDPGGPRRGVRGRQARLNLFTK